MKKPKNNSLIYEKQVEGLEPTHIDITKHRIKTEWVFDDYTIFRYVDKTTGEILKWGKVKRGKRQSPDRQIVKSDKPFVMLFDTAMQALQKKIITFNEYAILVAAANLIDWHDYRYVVDSVNGTKLTILGFAKTIHRDYESVLRYLKSLEKKGFVKLEETGNATYIIIGANIAYKGKLDKVTGAVNAGKPAENISNTNKQIAKQSLRSDVHYRKNRQPLSEKPIMYDDHNGVISEADGDFEYWGQ